MNSKNCKTSDLHILIRNLSDKINLLHYQILVFIIHGKI